MMAYKLKTPAGRVIYRLRTCTVEPVFGIIQEQIGFRRFSLQGLRNVAGEWGLVSLAYNLRRFHSLLRGHTVHEAFGSLVRLAGLLWVHPLSQRTLSLFTSTYHGPVVSALPPPWYTSALPRQTPSRRFSPTGC